MKKHFGGLSWLIGQVVAGSACYGLAKEHGFYVGMVAWIVATILLDIRYKIKGYYE